jgi:hypothetical protein
LSTGIAEALEPLAAELVLRATLGAIETGLPDDADEQGRLEALTFMLGQMIVHAERCCGRGTTETCWGPSLRPVCCSTTEGASVPEMVLVDHLLGGGVEDCWVSEGRAAKDMRNSLAAAMAAEPTTFFADIDAAGATDRLLCSALARPPCPEQPDQIEDVTKHLYRVRARVEHLARPAGIAPIQHQR